MINITVVKSEVVSLVKQGFGKLYNRSICMPMRSYYRIKRLVHVPSSLRALTLCGTSSLFPSTCTRRTNRNYSQFPYWQCCKSRVYCVESSPQHFQRRFYGTENLGNEELEQECTSDDAIVDAEYNECVRYYCSIFDAGHRVYVIQPVPKNVPKKDMITTGPLMLEESCALVNTLPNWRVMGKTEMRVRNLNHKYVFGKGQLVTLTQSIRSTPGVSAVFVSIDMLSQVQLNFLQNGWKLPVYDRYTIVLQIFKDHAKSQEAKLQIALAEIPFVRSRIEERHLHRQERSSLAGGVHVPYYIADKARYMIAKTALLQQKEKKLQCALSKLKTQRAVKRQHRLKRKIPTVAVIGYTNSGKTTLIKALTGDDRMNPENRLFATLDVTAHAGLLPNRMTALFMDTVGFISNIPHSLYDAFAATLEDAILADLVVHVRDISHPDTVAQRENVLETVDSMLSETQLCTMIEVCNKTDRIQQITAEEISDCFYVSSVTGEGLDSLRLEIQSRLLSNMGYLVKKMRIPLSGPHLEWLSEEATVTATENDNDYENIIVDVVINQEAYAKFMARFGPRRSTSSR